MRSPSAPALRAASIFRGFSKPCHERIEGLALNGKLAASDSEPWCGVQVIDLDTGACAHWFRIDGSVAEHYDVGVPPDVIRPVSLCFSLGFASDEILS
jgi:hypothetical protein